MSIVPGGNLLNQATKLIKTKKFMYYAYTGTTETDIGTEVHAFAAGIKASGSIQPVSQQTKKEKGIDLEGRMIEIWTPLKINSLARDRPSDQIGWDSQRWNIIESMNWSPIDGWNSVVAVEIKPETTNKTQ